MQTKTSAKASANPPAQASRGRQACRGANSRRARRNCTRTCDGKSFQYSSVRSGTRNVFQF